MQYWLGGGGGLGALYLAYRNFKSGHVKEAMKRQIKTLEENGSKSGG